MFQYVYGKELTSRTQILVWVKWYQNTRKHITGDEKYKSLAYLRTDTIMEKLTEILRNYVN